MPKTIVNLNKCNSVPLNIGHIHVGISRVKNHMDLRVMPWKPGETSKDHLYKLRHPDEYLIWNDSYNAQGNFDEGCMARAKDNLPPPIDPSLLSTQRPSRAISRDQNVGDSNSGRDNNDNRPNDSSSSSNGSNNSSSRIIGNGNNNSAHPNSSSDARSTNSGSVSTIYPSHLEQFRTLVKGAIAQTHSWIMVPFIQAIFECNVQNDSALFVIGKFYPSTTTWIQDVSDYRDSLKSFSNDLYEALRKRLIPDPNVLPYIPSLTQEVLLFIFDDTIHSLGHIESNEVRDFCQATQPVDPNNIDTTRMKTISDRLVKAIYNLQWKYMRYQDETGVQGISGEELNNIYPNGLEEPFY